MKGCPPQRPLAELPLLGGVEAQQVFQHYKTAEYDLGDDDDLHHCPGCYRLFYRIKGSKLPLRLMAPIYTLCSDCESASRAHSVRYDLREFLKRFYAFVVKPDQWAEMKENLERLLPGKNPSGIPSAVQWAAMKQCLQNLTADFPNVRAARSDEKKEWGRRRLIERLANPFPDAEAL